MRPKFSTLGGILQGRYVPHKVDLEGVAQKPPLVFLDANASPRAGSTNHCGSLLSVGAVAMRFALPASSPIWFELKKIPFRLENDQTPARNAPETMPGGVAVFDYNGDGRPDIFFTNGANISTLKKDSPKIPQ